MISKSPSWMLSKFTPYHCPDYNPPKFPWQFSAYKMEPQPTTWLYSQSRTLTHPPSALSLLLIFFSSTILSRISIKHMQYTGMQLKIWDQSSTYVSPQYRGGPWATRSNRSLKCNINYFLSFKIKKNGLNINFDIEHFSAHTLPTPHSFFKPNKNAQFWKHILTR